MPKKNPKPRVKPRVKPGSDEAFVLAEEELQKLMETPGKVNPGNLGKIKEMIAKKYGAYPMGGTR